jgi:hypothetical protein
MEKINKNIKKDYIHIEESDIPIYKGKLVIILTDSKKKLNKILPDFKDDEIYGHAWLAPYKNRAGYIIILNPTNSYSITHGVVSHEALHIVSFISKDRGIIMDPDNDEPLTYLIEYITDEVYRVLNKYKFKINTK